MKHKFSKMGRVAIALMLALSLSLITAAPVSAAVTQPVVTLSRADPNLAAIYTIEFTTTVDLEIGDGIVIEFPAGTTGLNAVVSGGDVTGVTVDSIADEGERLSITLSAKLEAGVITLEVGDGSSHGVINPPDGDYTLKVYTSQEPTAVTSETYMISLSLEVVGVTVSTPDPDTVATAAEYDIDFTTSANMRAFDDDIVIEFPLDTNISAVVMADVTVTGDVGGDNDDIIVDSISIDEQVLTITLGGALEAAPTNVTISNHIINPTTVDNPDPASGGDWRLTVYTSYKDRIPAVSGIYTLSEGTVVSQIVWFLVDEYVPNGETSGAFKIQTQDEYGNPVAVGGSTDFTLTASSGAFSVSTITISSGHTSSAFTYTEATAGPVTITADEVVDVGWTAAERTIIVNPMLELWGGGAWIADYSTFTEAIAAALPYDTIKVAPSTYDGDFTVDKPYLTIESTAGKASTFLIGVRGQGYGVMKLTSNAANFVLGGASGKGFTLQKGGWHIHIQGANDVIISYNTFDFTDSEDTGGIQMTTFDVSGLTVTENTFILDDLYDTGVRGNDSATLSKLTITNNDFTGVGSALDHNAIEINKLSISSTDSTISGNNITALMNGILIGDGEGLTAGTGTLKISDNTFDGLTYGINLVDHNSGVEQNVVITENTFTNNTNGLAISADGSWEPGDFAVMYNDFVGNTLAVFNNTTNATPADAKLDVTNNYWGSATGPSGEGSGTGDAVSTLVDYSPWLDAAYPAGDPVSEATITLVTGWNLISLPLIPVDSDIAAILADLIALESVEQVRTYDQGIWPSWARTGPPANNPLTDMEDGQGFWVQMSDAGSLVVSGYELARPAPAVPPQYEVVAGWNLIGYKFTLEGKIATYLGDVDTTLETIYDYDATTLSYGIPASLVKGRGYWIALTSAGTIYPEFLAFTE